MSEQSGCDAGQAARGRGASGGSRTVGCAADRHGVRFERTLQRGWALV